MTSIYEMTGLICPSEEQWRANGEKIYEIALYFDKMSAPVMSSIPDKLEMTDEEFEAFMLQMLTNGMNTIHNTHNTSTLGK